MTNGINLDGGTFTYDIVLQNGETIDNATNGLVKFGAGNVYFNDILFIGDSNVANTKMTTGITIDQGASDNEILAFKSSDVAHGMTSTFETDTYGAFGKTEGNGGGLTIYGLTDTHATAQMPLAFSAYSFNNLNAVKTTAALAAISVTAFEISGTGITNVVANGNVFAVRARIGGATSTLFIVDANGDAHTTDVVCGLGEGGVTALTGGEIRAPHCATGAGNDDVAGANLAVSCGFGRGSGTLGKIIFNGSAVAAADTVQTAVQVMEVQGGGVVLGIAGTNTGALGISGATSGTVTLTVAAAAGTWTMTLPTAVGTAGFQLTDAGGNGVTSWAAAASKRESKDVVSVWDKPQDALDRMLGTQVYRFHYKENMGTLDRLTEYVGIMADEAPWAMHYSGGVVNPVNTLGYMVLGFQAIDERLTAVEQANKVLREQLCEAGVLPKV